MSARPSKRKVLDPPASLEPPGEAPLLEDVREAPARESRRRERRSVVRVDSRDFNAIASQNQWTRELANPSNLNTMTDLDFIEIRIDTMYGALNKITGGDYQVIADLMTNYKEDKISWGRQGRKEVLQNNKPSVRFIPGQGAIMPQEGQDESSPAPAKKSLFQRLQFWKKDKPGAS